MNRLKMNGYTRISKVRARKMFDDGRPIYICPCKMAPGGSFGMGMLIDLKRWKEEVGEDSFEKMCNNFIYYNCSWEAGYYPSFYLTAADRNSK